MVDFEIGKTYISKKGMPFIVTEMNGDKITIQHNLLRKKTIKTLYGGVYAAIFNFGDDMILAEKIVPVVDSEIEFGYTKKTVTVNKHGETYVELFKKHKDEEN